jgi:CubicO group peptidase (beta-lactamase class C family)
MGIWCKSKFRLDEYWLTACQINIDWAGIALERVTGKSLNEYLHENIFKPLGLGDISMIPTKSMKSKLAYMNQRNPDGSLMSRDHLLRRPLVVESAKEISSCFNSGGAGCFAKPRDYCRKPLSTLRRYLAYQHRDPCDTSQQRNFAHDRCPNSS